MTDPIHPVHPENGPPINHLQVPVTKGVDQLTELLGGLDDLSQVDTLPPAVQGIVDLATQLKTLLTSGDLSGIQGIIPTLHKAIASLEPIIHQIKDEKDETGSIDFTSGPFSTAWTNSLLEKATTNLTDLINLIQ